MVPILLARLANVDRGQGFAVRSSCGAPSGCFPGLPSKQRLAGAGHTPLNNPGKPRQTVRSFWSHAQDVSRVPSVGDQGIGDMLSMASPRNRLGTEDGSRRGGR